MKSMEDFPFINSPRRVKEDTCIELPSAILTDFSTANDERRRVFGSFNEK